MKEKKIDPSKKTLILSGGDIHGAFQAGAIKAVLESGYEPDIIQGNSAGALNGAVLVNELGLKRNSATKWQDAGEALADIWLKSINKPSDIFIKRKWYNVGLQVLTKNFTGFIKTEPFRRLIYRAIKEQNLRNSEVTFLLGAVDLLEGTIEYRSNKTALSLIEYIIASASIPIALPLAYIENRPFCDAGLRDSAPLKHVIEAGADEMVIILTHPTHIQDLTRELDFNPKNLLQLVLRVVEIALREMLENDIQMLEKVNKLLIETQKNRIQSNNISLTKGKRLIKTTLIRPEVHYDVRIDKFKQSDIQRMFSDGYRIGREGLSKQQKEIVA